MGMRTIRWSNGQWAERIAHAGSEAVRLVPLFQLASCILDYRRLSFFRILAAECWLALSAKRAEPLGHYLRRGMKESAYSSRSA